MWAEKQSTVQGRFILSMPPLSLPSLSEQCHVFSSYSNKWEQRPERESWETVETTGPTYLVSSVWAKMWRQLTIVAESLPRIKITPVTAQTIQNLFHMQYSPYIQATVWAELSSLLHNTQSGRAVLRDNELICALTHPHSDDCSKESWKQSLVWKIDAVRRTGMLFMTQRSIFYVKFRWYLRPKAQVVGRSHK